MSNYAKLPPSRHYTFRLPVAEMEQFIAMAKEKGYSQAAMMRAAIGAVLDAHQRDKEKELVREIKRERRKMGSGRNK